jgi:hypothetical protein
MAGPHQTTLSSAIRSGWKVIVVDLVLLVALYYVSQDLQWRSDYAASAHDRCYGMCSYSPSYALSVLTRFFTMSGNGQSLTSPPTLDWVQLLAYAIILLNAWYAYAVIRGRKALHSPREQTPTNK